MILRVAAGGHEADVLAVGLRRRRQPEVAGELARRVLLQIAKREAQEAELLARGREQEIALVALGIAAPVKLEAGPARLAPHIMAGGERRGAELLGGLQQVAELDLLIAGDARHRRLAGEIAVGERVHHVLREPRLIVEHVMGNAESLRHAAGILNVLAGAAGALAADRLAVVVELERDADDVVALAP